ncbi:MAG: biotin/lipoyl-binding protein [Prosthecobacter sp.]|nr:biotin/lipoyl-binding protein [Prosthecobacter sp.]
MSTNGESMLHWNAAIALLFLILATLTAHSAEPARKLVCVGRVEPVNGEIEVFAQIAGTLSAVHVKEGQWVKAGTLLAEVDAPREQAALDLALAKLARVKAGHGKEEIAAAQAARDAIAEELLFADLEHDRALKLRQNEVRALSDDILDQRKQQAAILRKRLLSAAMQHEALKRGPLPEEIALAEGEVTAARAVHEMRRVKAAADGHILLLHRHAGDAVSLNFPTPILRMADTEKLRVRIEITEQEVQHASEGMQGLFTLHGAAKPNGRLRIVTLLPAFAPRRLFEPDSTARLDTRTLNALCEIVCDAAPVYAGQRVMAEFEVKE